MARATAQDLIARYDEREIRDLAADDGTPEVDISSSPKVSAALAEARGEVNSAALVANKYSVADLEALTGDDLEFLKGIECALAMAIMLKRRPGTFGEEESLALRRDAREKLALISSGKHEFNVAANLAAGKPTVDGPTAIDYQRLNMISDRVKNFYPSRGSRLPIGRS